MLKKAMIIYAILFALSIIIPAAVCLTKGESSNPNELVNIFRASLDFGVIRNFFNIYF